MQKLPERDAGKKVPGQAAKPRQEERNLPLREQLAFRKKSLILHAEMIPGNALLLDSAPMPTLPTGRAFAEKPPWGKLRQQHGHAAAEDNTMLTSDKRLFIAAAENPVTLEADGRALCLEARMASRHGLITGATGTGKTISLQTMAESFSAMGVPVLLTDIKGDLSAMSRPGEPGGSVAARIKELGLRTLGYGNRAYPVSFWDVAGEQGTPLRATISDMGPALLSRLLDLNEVQSGILHIVFRIADESGLLLLDLKDLRAMITHVAENRSEYASAYGHISPASMGAIQRGLLRLEEEGAGAFFGEPALNIEDLFRTDLEGRGYVNIIAADKLMQKPRLYASVLLWLLSELYEQLPERGNAEKPRLVLMFDEAHLLFDDMPEVLLQKVEQVVRLIRSRGVGVYFITQNPADIPDSVLSQLGNRVQHALRAFTPREQKAVRAAAETFRQNPALDTEEIISLLRTGEALVSFLDEHGAPAMVERALILPPEGGIGALSPEERRQIIERSPMQRLYGTPLDRESAYEKLTAQFQERRRDDEEEAGQRSGREQSNPWSDILGSATRQVGRTVGNAVGREVGRAILRGLLGGIFGGRR